MKHILLATALLLGSTFAFAGDKKIHNHKNTACICHCGGCDKCICPDCGKCCCNCTKCSDKKSCKSADNKKGCCAKHNKA